ncbi:hypothetical protein [Bradyrhizobium sp.]|uniref:hypothetical protein n=1 Tax=Bradyrhizobium sp. TaxID=376 RepID=UPI0039E610B7
MKPTKSLRKQADRAEAVAFRLADPELAAEMRLLANAYRCQADLLKKRLRMEKKLKLKPTR